MQRPRRKAKRARAGRRRESRDRGSGRRYGPGRVGKGAQGRRSRRAPGPSRRQVSVGKPRVGERRGGDSARARGQNGKTMRGTEARPVSCPLFSNNATAAKSRAQAEGRARGSSEPGAAAPRPRPALTCKARLGAHHAPRAAPARPPVARTRGKHLGPRLRAERRRPRRKAPSPPPARPRGEGALSLLRPRPRAPRDLVLPPRHGGSWRRRARAGLHGLRTSLLPARPFPGNSVIQPPSRTLPD